MADGGQNLSIALEGGGRGGVEVTHVRRSAYATGRGGGVLIQRNASRSRFEGTEGVCVCVSEVRISRLPVRVGITWGVGVDRRRGRELEVREYRF